MGRYYKTSDTKQLDFMYELPQELMMKAVQNADAMNDQIYNQTDLLGNALAKINHLTPDAERVQAIQAGYTSQIDAATKQLMADPANYRKQMPLVRELTRKLSMDMQSGELAGIMGEANRMAEWDKTYKPLVAKGDITPQAYTTMKSRFLKDYSTAGGHKYDAQTKTGNNVSTEDIYKTQNASKLIGDAVKDIKANSKASKTDSISGNQMWLITNSGKEEWVTAARVAQIATDSLMADDSFKGYLQQGGKYGYLQGVFGEDGKLIQPYTLDKTGKPVFNSESYLTPAIRAAVGTEAFTKSETSSTREVNDYHMEEVQFSNAIEKIKIQDGLDDENFREREAIKDAYTKENIRLRASLDGEGGDGTTPTVIGKDKEGKPIISPSLPKVTSSPDGIMTVTPFGGDNALTSDKIKLSLGESKANAFKLAELLKNPNLSLNDRATYQQELDLTTNKIKSDTELAQKADASLNRYLTKDQGYSPEDIAKLKTWNQERKNLVSQIDHATSNLASVYNPNNPSKGDPKAATEIMAYRKRLETKLNKFDRIQKTADKYTSRWFNENSEASSHVVDGVGLEAGHKKLIYNQLQHNFDGFTARNLDTDKEQEWSEYKQLFENGKASEVIDILTVNKPVPGLGATMTFKFKDLDGSGNTTGKQYIMTMPSSTQLALSQRLTNGVNAKQKEIAKLYKDQVQVNFLSSIKNKIADSVDPTNTQPSGFYTYNHEDEDQPENSYTTQIKVVPNTNLANPKGAPISYKVQALLMDGTYKDLPLPVKKGDKIIKTAEFASEEAIAEAFSLSIDK